MTLKVRIEVPVGGGPYEARLVTGGAEWVLAPGDVFETHVYPGNDIHVSEAPVGTKAAWQEKAKRNTEAARARVAARDEGDFPLGKACDLSGDTGCEACQ